MPRTFPPFQLLPMPEDFKKYVTSNPTDDDGLPAELDAPVAFSAIGDNVIVTQPPPADAPAPFAGDPAYAEVKPTPAAKNGDTVSILATITSEGVVSTQQGDTLLTAGGATGAAFSESASFPINPAPAE